MKKILAAVLALTVLAVCAVPAFAESGSTKIYTKSEPDYLLSFPADTEIPWESPSWDIGAVTAKKMLIEPEMCVKVSVSSQNNCNLVNAQDAQRTIAYTLAGADSIVFEPGDYGRSFPLTVNVSADQWAQAASGEHTDLLTFTFAYAQA